MSLVSKFIKMKVDLAEIEASEGCRGAPEGDIQDEWDHTDQLEPQKLELEVS
jgi:hypothetical protein